MTSSHKQEWVNILSTSVSTNTSIEVLKFFMSKLLNYTCILRKNSRGHSRCSDCQKECFMTQGRRIGIAAQRNGSHAVFQTNPVRAELFSHINTFFCSNKWTWPLATEWNALFLKWELIFRQKNIFKYLRLWAANILIL